MINKIQFLSDLHIDTQKRDYFEVLEEVLSPVADLIVFAGDIVEYDSVNKFLSALGVWDRLNGGKEYIWIMGNHEFYRGNFGRVVAQNKKRVKESSISGLQILDDETVFFNEGTDLEFMVIGSTLWTDLSYLPGRYAVEGMMNDYNRIKGFDSDWVQINHDASVRYIKNQLQDFTTKPAIVVTHHNPSFNAVPDEYVGCLTNYGFASNLDSIMHESWAPTMWVHGHTHHEYDEMHGQTRVYRNPYGYRAYGEHNFTFDRNKIVDVQQFLL